MATREPVMGPVQHREGQLERAFIDEFLRTRGHDLHSAQALPAEVRNELLRDASVYAAAKLAEVEARAHFVHELEGER
jgi:hypothetical protein